MINAFKQIRLTNLNVSGLNGRIDVGNSGTLAFSSELDATGAYLDDLVSGLYDITTATDLNVSGLIDTTNYLLTGNQDLLDLIPQLTGDVDNLQSGLMGAFDVLIAHEDRLSGIDDAVNYLFDSLTGTLNPQQQSFSEAIPSGVEEYTVLFPSGEFESVPTINVSLESEVGYMFALKNKNVSGFDITFSDFIQESGVSIDVFASIKF